MNAPLPEDILTQLLRQSDPMREDPGLSPIETAEMRRTVIAGMPGKAPGFWPQLSPVLSVVVLLAVALGIAWFPSATPQSTRLPVPVGERTVDYPATSAGAGSQDAGAALENRKIQFETPGGTLVVWVLNPNFPS